MNFARLMEGVGIALESIRSAKGRAALTIMGVAIGVAVVVGMASAIKGVSESVVEQIESGGPKTFYVFRYWQGGIQISDGSDELSPWRRNPWLTVEEADLIRQQSLIRDVTVSESTGGAVSSEHANLPSVSIAGFSPSWVLVTGGEITAGRNFTQLEYAANHRVAIINDKLAESLFPGLDPIGKRIKVFGQPFQVIGLHVAASSLFGGGSSPRMVIPHSTFQKVANYRKGWMQFSVMPVEHATVVEAQDQVIATLRSTRAMGPSKENNFDIVTSDKFMEAFDQVTGAFFMVMLVLSAVGLMVGGVGVVAVMMISVTERTREIGVRKALGATRKEILFQFLVEASTLTAMGGLVGMALGALVAFLVRVITPIPATIPLWSIAAALLASVVTGVFFGIYPALKASRLDPVEALRWE